LAILLRTWAREAAVPDASLSPRNLTNREAIRAVQYVIQEWAKRNGLAILAVWQQIEQARAGENIDPWLLTPPEDDERAAEQCRGILRIWLESGLPEFANLARAGMEASKQAQAQVLDPLSISAYGLLIIGLVLALRIKEVNVGGSRSRFVFGRLPKGAIQIIKTATAAISKLPGLNI
jgi:hypothetical protein